MNFKKGKQTTYAKNGERTTTESTAEIRPQSNIASKKDSSKKNNNQNNKGKYIKTLLYSYFFR